MLYECHNNAPQGFLNIHYLCIFRSSTNNRTSGLPTSMCSYLYWPLMGVNVFNFLLLLDICQCLCFLQAECPNLILSQHWSIQWMTFPGLSQAQACLLCLTVPIFYLYCFFCSSLIFEVKSDLPTHVAFLKRAASLQWDCMLCFSKSLIHGLPDRTSSTRVYCESSSEHGVSPPHFLQRHVC